MAGLSYFRFAVGVCVLAAGLLMGARGAVAVADPGSSGSAAHGDDGTNASGQQPSHGAKKPKDEPGGTDTKDGSLGAGGQSGQQPSHGAKKPTDEPGGTDTKDGTKDDLDLGAAVPDPVAAVPNEVAPVLLGIAGVPPVVGGVGGADGPGLSAAAGASVASRLPLGLPFAGISGPPLAGVSGLPVTGEATTEVAPLDVIALGRASAVSGMAPLAPDAVFPIGAGSSLRHVFGEILLPVSLWVLAAGALPGAGGLAILFATGARLGYRQAKTGIAHFARPGAVPLGVVRSGSLVAIRPRALRVVRPGALSAGGLLDKVA